MDTTEHLSGRVDAPSISIERTDTLKSQCLSERMDTTEHLNGRVDAPKTQCLSERMDTTEHLNGRVDAPKTQCLSERMDTTEHLNGRVDALKGSVSQRTYGHYRTPQRTCRCSQGFSVSANVWTLPNTSTDV